jgi:hypothetical protein
MSRFLRWAAVVYLVAFVVHFADHLRRGVSASPRSVIALGSVTALFQVVAIGAVLLRRSSGPLLAVAVGLPDAIGIVAVHLLPRWSGLSDAFPGAAASAGVTWFSWVTAVAEALAAAAFAWAGWVALRRVGVHAAGSAAG